MPSTFRSCGYYAVAVTLIGGWLSYDTSFSPYLLYLSGLFIEIRLASRYTTDSFSRFRATAMASRHAAARDISMPLTLITRYFFIS